MSKSDFAERIMAFMRHRTQHFNPQKYFRMRDKVISSAGGGYNCTSCFCFTE